MLDDLLANITFKQVIYYYGGRWVIHYADTFTCALDRLQGLLARLVNQVVVHTQ